jgi:hypothetical protein
MNMIFINNYHTNVSLETRQPDFPGRVSMLTATDALDSKLLAAVADRFESVPSYAPGASKR